MNKVRGFRTAKHLGPSINSILQPVFSILNLEKVDLSSHWKVNL